jgi:hypothetical protein
MIKRKKKKRRRLQGNIIMSMESGINFLMTTVLSCLHLMRCSPISIHCLLRVISLACLHSILGF